MPPRRRWAMRLLFLAIVLLSIVEYLVATIGVQLTEIPVRTDFASYYCAGRLTAAAASPYDAEALAREGHALGYAYDQYPFLYPPPFALLMRPLAQLPFARARAVWMLLSTVCLAVALIVTVRVVQLLHRRSELQVPDLVWWLMVPFLVMVLNSSALHNDVRQGSVGAMLWMVLILMLHALLRGKATAAALWLAAATLLKLVPLLLLPWFAWRAGRRAAGVTLLALVCSMIPALLVWGPAIVVWYGSDALWPAAQLQIAWPNNVSLAALWMRLLTPVSGMGSTADLWAPVSSVMARSLSLLSDVALLTISLWSIHQARHRGNSLHLELSTLVLVMLLGMRLTWVQTLTTMLFIYPFLMHWGVEKAAGNRRASATYMVVASLGFFLAAAHLPVLWGERGIRWPWLLAPGLHTFGLLLLWSLCVRALRDAHQPPGTMTARVP